MILMKKIPLFIILPIMLLLMIAAGRKSNEINMPVILNPVGVSASKYRTETIQKLLKEINFSIIRGNLSEIKALCGLNSLSKGVDSQEDSSREGEKVALMAARLHNTVVATLGVLTMGLAGEIAYDSPNQREGIGSFKVKLMDAIYNFSIDDINKRGKIYE